MRLNWIGIALFGSGVVIAIAGVVYYMVVRPVAGAEIDRVAVEVGADKAELVIRAEQGGDRSFIELVEGGELKWQALIPHYAGRKGRPAVAWGRGAATVRIERGGRAEVFAFKLSNGDKVGGYRLALEHEPITTEPTGPLTITDHQRAYELVGGPGWHQVVAIDLGNGVPAWKDDLGPDPISDARVDGDHLVVTQGSHVHRIDAATGRDEPGTDAHN